MAGHMQQPKKPDERNFLSFFLYFEGQEKRNLDI